MNLIAGQGGSAGSGGVNVTHTHLADSLYEDSEKGMAGAASQVKWKSREGKEVVVAMANPGEGGEKGDASWSFGTGGHGGPAGSCSAPAPDGPVNKKSEMLPGLDGSNGTDTESDYSTAYGGAGGYSPITKTKPPHVDVCPANMGDGGKGGKGENTENADQGKGKAGKAGCVIFKTMRV